MAEKQEVVVPFAGSNEAVAEDVVRYVDDIEALQDQIDEVMAEAREVCAPYRDDIKQTKLDAHEATNVARAAMNDVIATRRTAKKNQQRRARLSSEHRATADEIQEAMPDQAKLF